MKWIALAGFGLITLYSIYKIIWVRLNLSVIAGTVKLYIIGQTKKILNEYHIKRQTLIAKKLQSGFEKLLNDVISDGSPIEKEFKDEIEIEVNNCKNRLEKLNYYNVFKNVVPVTMLKIYWYSIVHGVNDFRKFIDQEYYMYITEEASKTKDLKVTNEHLQNVLKECIKE